MSGSGLNKSLDQIQYRPEDIAEQNQGTISQEYNLNGNQSYLQRSPQVPNLKANILGQNSIGNNTP